MSRRLPYIEPSIRTIAGVLLSAAGLVIYFSSEHTVLSLVGLGLLFFVSLNLAQSGVTRFCLMEHLLKKAAFRSELDEIQQLVREREQLLMEEKLLQDIDQQVLHGKGNSALLGFVCSEIARRCGYPFVWLGRKQEDGDVAITAWSGSRTDFFPELQARDRRWNSPQLELALAGQCISRGQVVSINDLKASSLPTREMDERFGFRAAVALPLYVKEQVYGCLVLFSDKLAPFDDESLQRLGGIARRISVALEMSMAQEQLQLLGAALTAAGNGVFITDQRGVIQWVNDSFTRLTGYTAVEAIGERPSLLKSGVQDEAYYQRLWDTLLKGRTWSSEVVDRHKSGKFFTVQQTITPILDEAGRVTHFVSILDDVSEKKEAAARIQYMAHFDALTALPNRVLFYDRLHQVLAQARRDGRTSALLFLDLDRFKAVNDTLGHLVGDQLLQEVASRLKSCVRESDTVSRLAGDEFTVLLSQVGGNGDVEVVAEKIIAALAQPFSLQGREISIGTSIGIAFYPQDADSDEALVRCADIAMYAAKEQGRGTFRYFQLHPELASA